MFCAPMPPAPITATFTLSAGESLRAAARVWPGRIASPAAAAELPTNALRLMPLFSIEDSATLQSPGLSHGGHVAGLDRPAQEMLEAIPIAWLVHVRSR